MRREMPRASAALLLIATPQRSSAVVSAGPLERLDLVLEALAPAVGYDAESVSGSTGCRGTLAAGMAVGAAAASREGERCSGRIVSPAHSTAARSASTFRSSRTFPGQRYRRSRASASGDTAPREGAIEALAGGRDERLHEKVDLGGGAREGAGSEARCPPGGSRGRSGNVRSWALSLDIAVRRRHETDVDGARACRTEARHHALFEDPQELSLHRQRQVADLVEEDRSAAGRLE